MSRLNMVRKKKEKKKDQIRIQDTFESKREKGWDERFIYNKLEDNANEKRPIPKKPKNDYISNIKYLKEQFNADNINQKKNNKKRGKSGYKGFNVKKNNSNNKIKINSNNVLRNDNNNNNIFGNNNIEAINNTGDNDVETISLFDDKKSGYTNNNYKFINRNNNSLDMNNNTNNNCLGNINNISNNNSSTTLYSKTLSELEVYVGMIWNKLGVKDSFQKTFNTLKEDMENEEAKKEFMIMEIENLEKLEKFLKNLSKDIENRERALLLLKKLIELIERQFIELNLDVRDNVLKDFYQTIFAYRMNTIKVVENISIYKELFSYPIYKGKFYEDYLIRRFKLIDTENNKNNGNYLLKIKNDLNFLGKSKINGYKQLNLNFNSTSDPFLLSVADQIPFSLDYCNRIKQCQYIIMQEIIFNKINNGFNNSNINDISINDMNKKKKLESLTSNNNNNNNNNNNILIPNAYKVNRKEKENICCIDKNENIKKNNNERKMNVKNKKIEKIEIETQLIDKKNYDNFFGPNNLLDEQSEEQTLEEIKKELNNMNNSKKLNKNDDKINNNKDNNEDFILKNDKEKINVEINEDNNKNKDNNDNKKEKDNKDNEIKNENKKIGQMENAQEINEERKSEENNNKNKENNKNETIVDKDNNEDMVNLEENININEEQNKIVVNNKDNNIEDNVLQNSLIISKKMKNSQEKSRSVTPKSNRDAKIISIKETEHKNKDNNSPIVKNEINILPIRDNDYIAFYCGKISNFIPIYSSYYNTIPEEQKTIFNLNSDPLEYIYNNLYPKIIIYSDIKTKKIKGLCIISHIFTNESKNNGLFIEHISSSNEDEQETVFEKLLNFIKENSFSIFGFENSRKDKDIYIDLYYKCEDGKFTINTNIRDYFRNQLKFKWVKLENLSKFVRFQKMRHQFIINNGINNNIDLLNNEYDDNNILNQSILGRKEFNNEDNKNESDAEEDSEDDDEINVDISTIFDIDNKNNEYHKSSKHIIDFHNGKSSNLLNNFSIKNKTILKFNSKQYNRKKNTNLTTYIKYSNTFNFIYLLNKINASENISYENITPNINSYFNQKDSTKINQLLSDCIDSNKSILTENNFYFSDLHEIMDRHKNKFKINTNLNIFPLFDKVISFKYNNYYYNRIQQKKIQNYIDAETQQIF